MQKRISYGHCRFGMYLQAVYGKEYIPLPFRLQKLSFWYHPDAFRRSRHPIWWPMARCLCTASPYSGNLHACHPLPNMGPCNQSTCAPWGLAQENLTPPVIPRDSRLQFVSRQEMVKELTAVGQRSAHHSFESSGVILFSRDQNLSTTHSDQCVVGPATKARNRTWIEVMRVQQTQLLPRVWNMTAHVSQRMRPLSTEGQAYYGCWFWPARGSGIWIDTGQTWHLNRRTGSGQALIHPWLEWHSMTAAATVHRPPKEDYSAHFTINRTRLQALSDAQQKALNAVEHFSGKEVALLLAYGMGVDTLQMSDCSQITSEVIMTRPACMLGGALTGPCTKEADLMRAGWHARLACRCDERSLLLNCDATE